MSRHSPSFIISLLLIALFALSIFALMIGPQGFSCNFWQETALRIAIFKYRYTRVLLAIIAGSSLAMSGASLQALFRNPLADPHLFGISGGAALGASIVIAFLADSTTIMPSAGAIVGGLLAFLLVIFYVHKQQEDAPLSNCLLVGILINSLAAALITLLKVLLPAHKTQSLLFWLVGNISAVHPQQLVLIIPLWLIGMAALWMIKGELEILSFGTDETTLLGINVSKIIRISIVANCILIGNVVAFAGMIGFLGLVVPHLVRLFIDANLRIMLPIASILGALLLVFFDTLSRVSFLFFDTELPVGALSALLLSPIFFWLLIKSQAHG